MLGQLHIKNIGIIDDITINFEDGFNVMTGETGSGKSLIIGSIAAVTGSRISKDILKTGVDSALIEAYFFEKDKDIILSREIFANGRNICKIDGKMATLAQLKELGESLIDIHGQHDNQSLLNPSMHLELLDKFIGEEIATLKNEYLNKLNEYKEIKKELENNFGDEKDRSRKIDLLQYQINEIEQAKLKQGEEEELNARRNLMINSEKIVKALSNTYYNLNDIVIDNLGMAVHELSTIAALDENYDNILLNLNEAFYMLKDSASDTLDAMNSVEFDENEQNEIEERLDIIYNLRRKYGHDIESVLKYYEEISDELYKLQNSDEIINQLNQQLEKISKELKELALKMRKVRKENSVLICQKVNQELKELEMKNASIEFEFKELESFYENGMDDVQILITTNLGEASKPLHKIASGGEISRIMLALKNVFANVDDISCMIFDEIDTGISGQAAKVVAEKMNQISQNHQLICITHLPIIAAYGDENYFISKNVEDEKTHTNVTKLAEEELIKELARILDGDTITDISLKHAKELRKLKKDLNKNRK
ncbi:MAG: DNA repair protein RecN [Clostridia bacterium]|nr:DNA repair protein RecN [Clostridia bacterium]